MYLINNQELTYRLDGGKVKNMYNDNRCTECGGIMFGDRIICRDCFEKWCLDLQRRKTKVTREKEDLKRRLHHAAETIVKLIDTVAENQRYIEELRDENIRRG